MIASSVWQKKSKKDEGATPPVRLPADWRKITEDRFKTVLVGFCPSGLGDVSMHRPTVATAATASAGKLYVCQKHGAVLLNVVREAKLQYLRDSRGVFCLQKFACKQWHLPPQQVGYCHIRPDSQSRRE